MLERITKVCFEYITALIALANDIQSVDWGANEERFHVTMDGTTFNVIVDDFDNDGEDTDKGSTLSRREHVKMLDQDSPHPHGDILDACLDAISQNEEIRFKIRDLTTDGDSKDCEAIFDVEGYGYVILKVR